MIHANIEATFFYYLETKGVVCTDAALEAAEMGLLYALEEFDGFSTANKIKVTEIYIKSNRKDAVITFTAEDIIFVDQAEIDWALKLNYCDKVVITEDNTPNPNWVDDYNEHNTMWNI